MKSVLLVLLLTAEIITFVNTLSGDNELTLLCETLSSSKIIPNDMANRYALYLSSKNTNALPLVGMILGLVFAPVIAPLFAAPGLFGAAAVSNGLATLGGGNLLAGGMGMMGGTALVGLTGATVGSILSYSSYSDSYNDFMKTQPNRFYDSIILGDYKIQGYFKYSSGNTLLDGPTKIYKFDDLVFDDYVHCNTNLKCELIYNY